MSHHTPLPDIHLTNSTARLSSPFCGNSNTNEPRMPYYQVTKKEYAQGRHAIWRLCPACVDHVQAAARIVLLRDDDEDDDTYNG